MPILHPFPQPCSFVNLQCDANHNEAMLAMQCELVLLQLRWLCKKSQDLQDLCSILNPAIFQSCLHEVPLQCLAVGAARALPA